MASRTRAYLRTLWQALCGKLTEQDERIAVAVQVLSTKLKEDDKNRRLGLKKGERRRKRGSKG